MTRAGLVTLYTVAAWHSGWGVMLTLSPEALGPTPLAALSRHISSRPTLAMVLLAASASAILAARVTPGLASLGLMLPQQALLISTATSILRAVATGQYADGVGRAPIFILADQWPALMLVISHTVALGVLHGHRG